MPLYEIVLPTFFAIFVGYLVGRLTKIDIGPVVDVALYVGIPALIIIALLEEDIVLVEAAKIWGAFFLIVSGTMLVAWLVYRLLKQKHTGMYVAIALMNTINIPFPIVSLAYGTEGLLAASLFYFPSIITMYSLGIYLVAGRHWTDNVREIFRQPAIYAVMLGLALNFLDVQMPSLMFNSIKFISQIAIPMVLLVLGYNLSRVRMTSFSSVLLASFLRIGVGLLMGLLAVNLLGITGVFRAVVILDSAMPSAALSSILATKYNSESREVSSTVFLTTLASLAIIPLLLYLLGTPG